MDGMMMRHSQKLPVKLIQMRLVINPGIQKTYPTEHNLGNIACYQQKLRWYGVTSWNIVATTIARG